MPSSRRITSAGGGGFGGGGTAAATTSSSSIGEQLFTLLASSERLLERLYELPPCEVLEDLESAYPEACAKMRKRFPLPPRAEDDGASAVLAVVAGTGGGGRGAGAARDARRRWLGAAAPLLAVLADAVRMTHAGPRLLADLHVALDPLDCGDGGSLRHSAPLLGALARLIANLSRLAVAVGSQRVAPALVLALQARAAVEGQCAAAAAAANAARAAAKSKGEGEEGAFSDDNFDDDDEVQGAVADDDEEQEARELEAALLRPHEDPALREAVAAAWPPSFSSSPPPSWSSSSSSLLREAAELVAAAVADPSGRVLQPRLRPVAPRVAQLLELVVGPAVGSVATASAVAARGALDVLEAGCRPRAAAAFGLLLQRDDDGEGGEQDAAAVVDALATRLSRETSLAESWASGGGGGGGIGALARSSSNNSLRFPASLRRGREARPSSGSRPSSGGRGGDDDDEDDNDADGDGWGRRLSTVRRPSQGTHLRPSQQQQQQLSPVGAVAYDDGTDDDEDDDDDEEEGGFASAAAAAAPLSPAAAASRFALDLEEHRGWALFALLACPEALASPGARRLLALLLRESLLLPLHGRGGWCVPLHPLFEQAVGPTLARVCSADAAAARAAAAAAAAAVGRGGQGQEEDDEGVEGENDDEDDDEVANVEEEDDDDNDDDEAAAAGGRRGGGGNNLRRRGADLWRRHRLAAAAKKGACGGGSAAAATAATAAAAAAKVVAVVVAPEDSPNLVREAWQAAAQTAWRERASRRRLAAAKLAEACDWLSMLPAAAAPSSSSSSPSPFAKALAARQDALLAAISYGVAECRWYFAHAGEELRVPVVVVATMQQQEQQQQQPQGAAAVAGGRVRGAFRAALSSAAAAAAATAGAVVGPAALFQTAAPVPSDPEALDLVRQLSRCHALLSLRRREVAECAALCARRAASDRSPLGQAAAALRAAAAAPGAHPRLKEAAALIDAIRREALERAGALSSPSPAAAAAAASSSSASSFDAFARRLELRASWLRLLAALSVKRGSTGAGAAAGSAGPCAMQVAAAARDPRLFFAASELLERRLPALEGFVFEGAGGDEGQQQPQKHGAHHHHHHPLPPTAGAFFDARCDLHAALAPPAHLDKLTALARAAVDAAAGGNGGGFVGGTGSGGGGNHYRNPHGNPTSVAAACRLLSAAPAVLGALHWVARPGIPQPEAYDCSSSSFSGGGGGAFGGGGGGSARGHEAAADRAAGVILLQTLVPALRAAASQAHRMGEVRPLSAAEEEEEAAARWVEPAEDGGGDGQDKNNNRGSRAAERTLQPPQRACSPRGGAFAPAAAAASAAAATSGCWGVPPNPPQAPAGAMGPLARALHLAAGLAALGPAVPVTRALAVRPVDHVRRAMRACLSSLLSSSSSSTPLPLPSELELRARDLIFVCARVQSVLVGAAADAVGPDLLELLLMEGGQQADDAEAVAARASSVGKGGQGGRGGGGGGPPVAVSSAAGAAAVPASVAAAADGSEGAVLHFAPSARAAALAAAGSLVSAASASAAAAAAASAASPGRPNLVAQYADRVASSAAAGGPQQQPQHSRYATLAEVTALARLFGPCAAVAVARRLEAPVAEAVMQLDDALSALAADPGGQQALKALLAAAVPWRRRAAAAGEDEEEDAAAGPAAAGVEAAAATTLLPPEALAAVASRLGGGRAHSVTAAAAALGRALRLRQLAGAALERAMREEAPLVVAVACALGTPSATRGGSGRHVCDVFGLPRPHQHQAAGRQYQHQHSAAPDPFLAALLVGTAASGARLRRWCGWPVALGVAFATAAGDGGGGGGGCSGSAEDDQDVATAVAALALATHSAVDRGLDLGARLLKPYGSADVAADAAALFEAAARASTAAAAVAAPAGAAADSSSSFSSASVALALARHLAWRRSPATERPARPAVGNSVSSKAGAAATTAAKEKGNDQATRVWAALVASAGASGDGCCWIDAK